MPLTQHMHQTIVNMCWGLNTDLKLAVWVKTFLVQSKKFLYKSGKSNHPTYVYHGGIQLQDPQLQSTR
jgi:hypothetical protein